MAYVINSSVLNAQNALSRSQTALNSKFQELSASARNKISTTDRAAEMIAEQERAKALEAESAKTNAVVSKLQTDEGNLSESSTVLSRMREVVLQASDTSTSAGNRAALNDELADLKGSLESLNGTAAGDALNKSYTTASGNSYHVLGSAAGQGSREISISASTTADDYKDMLSAIDSMQNDVTTARAGVGETMTEVTQSYTDAIKQSAVNTGLPVRDIGELDNSAVIELAKKAQEAMEAARLNISNMFNNSAHATIMSLLR